MKFFDRGPDQEGGSGWLEGEARGSAGAIECDKSLVAAKSIT